MGDESVRSREDPRREGVVGAGINRRPTLSFSKFSGDEPNAASLELRPPHPPWLRLAPGRLSRARRRRPSLSPSPAVGCVFLLDVRYEENEAMWSKIKAEILGESDSDEEEEDGEGGEDDDDSDEDDGAAGHTQTEMTQQVRRVAWDRRLRRRAPAYTRSEDFERAGCHGKGSPLSHRERYGWYRCLALRAAALVLTCRGIPA